MRVPSLVSRQILKIRCQVLPVDFAPAWFLTGSLVFRLARRGLLSQQFSHSQVALRLAPDFLGLWPIIFMVGMTGLEPATSRPPAVRASQLRHIPRNPSFEVKENS